MEIETVCILGQAESSTKLAELLTKADAKVITADFGKDLDKQVLQADLILEATSEDINTKTEIVKSYDAKPPMSSKVSLPEAILVPKAVFSASSSSQNKGKVKPARPTMVFIMPSLIVLPGLTNFSPT